MALVVLAQSTHFRYHAESLKADDDSAYGPTSGGVAVQNTSFLQTQTILQALEFTLAKGGFGTNARNRKTASSLVKSMRSTNSVSGRHHQLRSMLRKGATIDQMIKASGSSRRTIFRYLNHFEDAGVELTLSGGKYKLK